MKNLDKNRFYVAIACSTKRDSAFLKDIENMTRNGLDVYQINMTRRINPIMDITAILGLYRLILSGKFEIVHCHSSKAGALGRIAAFMAGTKNIIYTPHAFAFQAFERGITRSILILVERLFAKITSKIVCVSQSEKKIGFRGLYRSYLKTGKDK